MRQNIFWLIGFLFLSCNKYVKCSIENNEISSLEDKPPLNNVHADFNVNFLVDAILAATREAIIAEGASRISLDPVDTNITIPLGIATVDVNVRLINGTLRALDSIKRRGDAKFIPRIIHRELDVVATLGLQTAEAEYYYYLKVLGMHPNGNLTAVINKNAVEVKFALNLDRQGCHLKLTELKMTQCSDVEVTLTGLYPFDTWSSQLATKLLQPLDGKLANKIEDTLRYFIEQEIHKIPCN